MGYKCFYCGVNISDYSYICSNCGKVCKEKIVKLSGKNTLDIDAAGKQNRKVEVDKSGAVQANIKPSKDSTVKDNIAASKKNSAVNVNINPSAIDNISATKSSAALNAVSGFDFSACQNLDSSIKISDKDDFDVNDIRAESYKQKFESQNQKNQNVKNVESKNNAVNKANQVHYRPDSSQHKPHHNISEQRKQSGPRDDVSASSSRMPLRSDCTLLEKIEVNNKKFVSYNSKQPDVKNPAPRLKLAVLTCSCPSMSSVSESALGLNQGDACMIRVAGASTCESINSEVLRSLALGVHLHSVEEIIVLSHEDCILKQLSVGSFIDAMKKNGVKRTDIETGDMKTFMGGFSNCREGLRKTISFIQKSKTIPEDIAIHGMMLSPASGKLEVIVNGYSERSLV